MLGSSSLLQQPGPNAGMEGICEYLHIPATAVPPTHTPFSQQMGSSLV